MQHLVGSPVDSFMNALWASPWPIIVFRDHRAAATVALAAFAWLLCRAGRQSFGETQLHRAPPRDCSRSPRGAPARGIVQSAPPGACAASQSRADRPVRAVKARDSADGFA